MSRTWPRSPPRTSPVAPAARSPRALAKAATKHTPGDLPAHSFTTLLADLGTICLNTIAPADPALPGFRLVTTPTPLQRRASTCSASATASGPRSQQPGPTHHQSPGNRPNARITGGNFGLAREAGRRPPAHALRAALYGHAFNPQQLRAPAPATASALAWLELASLPMGQLSDPRIIRAALDGLCVRLDGSPAAANTITRKRAVLHGALG
jgi:hypothetical protein